MSLAVIIHEKGGQPRRQEFNKSEVTIGRVQGNDIILPKQNVSKRHVNRRQGRKIHHRRPEVYEWDLCEWSEDPSPMVIKELIRFTR